MKTSDKPLTDIQQNLNNPEFIKMLQEHPIVQAKIKQTKKNLGLLVIREEIPSSK